MRILRVRVPEFGPLRGVDLELAEGLNVVHGPNEAGKTTLLDFLLALLFRREGRRGTRLTTVLGELDRFGDASDAGGEVELRLRGDVHGYPGGPSLLHALGLEHAGLAGLFCVRSGEMEIPGDPGEFWTQVKKVLSGLPEGVETLRERAHAVADLTATGRLSDAGDPGVKTRHRELGDRIERLEALAERLPAVTRHQARIAELEERVSSLEMARRAHVVEAREELEAVEERLGALPRVGREELEAWEDAREAVARLEEKAEEAETRLEQEEKGLTERREARQEAGHAAEALEERLDRARELELEERARSLAGRRPEGGARRWAPPLRWLWMGLLGAGIAGAFFTPSAVLQRPGVLLLLGGALAAGGVLWWVERRLRADREELEEARRSLREDAAACGFEASGVEAVPEALRRLEVRARDAERELDVARTREEEAERRVEEGRETLETLRKRREEAEAEVEARADGAEVEELSEAREARRRREELEARRKELRAELEGLAGGVRAAREVEPPPEEAELPGWSAPALEEAADELRAAREELEELRREFDRAGLPEPEEVLSELHACRDERREIEMTRDAGLLAGRVFATMDEALEARLAEALGAEGSLSVGDLARRVTKSYVALERDDEGGLVVRDEDGRSFTLAELSRGARDQIFLALRVGLARSALEAARLEEGGFLLLDDAFLTADWGRRERLVEATGALAGEGWQVVYLTCDDHLRGLYEEAGARVHELQP